jgi:predicted permease
MLSRWIVLAASLLVPRDRRGEWREEWEAEFAHHEHQRARGRRSLLRDALGAVSDAAFLQAGQWRSLRFLMRNWRISVTAGLSLAVAIAATIVGLACWDALLLRPPGVPATERLRTVDFPSPEAPDSGISYEDFRTLAGASRMLTSITAFPYAVSSFELDFHGRRERVVATEVLDSYFVALGVQPRLGTLGLPHGRGAGDDVIVISEPLWRRLGGDPAIAGKTLRINQHDATVAGVAPESFRGMLFVWSPDVWMSARASEDIGGAPLARMTDRTQRWLHVVGRLAPGATDAATAAEINNLLGPIARQHPAEPRMKAVVTHTRTTPESERQWISATLAILVASVLLLLTVACANVTNLLLGLSLARRHELGVRAAIGASWWHLVLPQVRETLGLTAVSGAGGCFIAGAALRWLSSFRPAIGPFFPSPSVDLRPGIFVTLSAATLVLLCGLAIGLTVAWRNAREGLSTAINHSATLTHTPRARLRGGLVLVQMTVATLVLVALAITVNSLARLQRAPLGFSARHLSFIGINLPMSGYTRQTGPALYERIRERLEAMPGVEAVSFVDGPPFLGGWGLDTVTPADAPAGTPPTRGIRVSIVDHHYFSTMGIDIRAGRAFDASDHATAPEAVIVNETMARRLWPGGDPVGRRLQIANGDRRVTVVGVAADGKYDDIGEAQQSFMYVALSQHYLGDSAIVVRTAARTGPTLTTLASSLRDLEPHLRIGNIGLLSLDQILAMPLFYSRAVAAVVGAVCGLTLLLAIAGLYSATFYSVGQRRQELTLRMLLGAGMGHILGLALRSMAAVAIGGAAIGIAAGMALLPVVSSLFYGIHAVEPAVTAGVAVAAVAIVILTTVAVVWPLTRRGASIAVLR